MWHKIAPFILRNRMPIIGVVLLLTVFFGYKAATGIKLDNKYGILLPNNAPAKVDYDKFKQLFGEDGNVLIIAIQTDRLYTEEFFLKWKELGDSILKFDGVESVVSEATLFTITKNKEKQKFEARPVFSDIRFKDKSIDSIQKEIRSNPFYEGLIFNSKTNTSLMLIKIDEAYISDKVKSKVVLDIEELAESYSNYFGKPYFAGLPHLRIVIGKQIMKEMYIFVGLLFVITALLIYLFFRSLRVVAICLTVVVFAVIWSMGMIGALEFKITVVMALIPPLMIVIGIPNSIFLITKFHQEMNNHGNKIKALTRVIEKIGTATFLTNLTTAFGFLTFVTTNSSKLMEFGVCAAINIMLVFVLSITILPIFLSFSPKPKEKHLKHLKTKLAVGLLNTLIKITETKRKWVYIITVLVVVLSLAGISQMQTTGNLTGDLPQGHRIIKDFNFIQDNFGGSIPFEIMINYKEPGRLAKTSTLKRIKGIEDKYQNDTLFSKFISYIDLLKVANMAYYDNDSSQYRLVTRRRHLARLKKYIENSVDINGEGSAIALNEFIDTAARVLRIRSSMKDIGSYEIAEKEAIMREEIDSILNPNKKQIEKWYQALVEKGNDQYADSIIFENSAIYNELTSILSNNDPEKQMKFDEDPELIKKYYKKKDFNEQLRKAIDEEYFDFTLTGTSIVASNGTKYMVINLMTSLLFAIIAIAILMALLFKSWKMVLVSLVPNFIPLLFTAGVMGWFGIPLKPSTLLVFSIAFGISIDDTIHYLAKYRQELKRRRWNLKECVIMAIREAGLGMFYTSIVLFCGFSVFTFSQFGGTQALGLLISLTLIVAMITNLVLLPSLLLTLERRLTTKSFEEPYFDVYLEESNLDWADIPIKEEDSK